MKNASYSVRKEGDRIVLRTTGAQQVASIQAMHEKIQQVVAKGSQPFDILVISKGVGAPDASAVQQAMQGLSNLSFRRLAVVGETPERLASAREVVKGAEDEGRHKVFRSEEDARAWLDELADNPSKKPKNKL